MAFKKRNPSEGKPKGTKNAPRGKVSGKMAGPSGHPVKGRGKRS